MQKPGLLMIGNFLSAGISHRWVCEDVAELLAERGWTVYRTSRRVNRPLRLAEMMLHPALWSAKYQVATVDVFSGRSFLWAEAATLCLRWLAKPYVLVLHGGGLLDWGGSHPKRITRLLAHATAVITPSQRLAEGFRTVRSDIRYLPNGIKIPAYHFRLRAKPGPQICWLRALDRIYNPEMALRALALLLPEFPEATLELYGRMRDARTGASLRKIIADSGLDGHVRLMGVIPKDRVPSALSRSDVFLNTTRFESFGVSVMEAAASGLCIVCTAVGEIPLLWTHERDALLVPPDDAEAMAAAVRRILTEPGLAARLSENARRKAEQFDWSIVLPQWEQLLLEVAERGSS
jgi:glycosyltransferase involved in cell wall biosynthesis